MSAWISVKDEVPKVGKKVMVCARFVNKDEDGKKCRPQHLITELVQNQSGKTWWACDQGYWMQVTHWQELPELPEMED